jgi:hypothetical protein
MRKLYFLETQRPIPLISNLWHSKQSHLNPVDWKRSTGVLFVWDIRLDRYVQFNKFKFFTDAPAEQYSKIDFWRPEHTYT